MDLASGALLGSTALSALGSFGGGSSDYWARRSADHATQLAGQDRRHLWPIVKQGKAASRRLNNFLAGNGQAGFERSPFHAGYERAAQEGLERINGASAAQGRFLSGATGQAISEMNANQYNNAILQYTGALDNQAARGLQAMGLRTNTGMQGAQLGGNFFSQAGAAQQNATANGLNAVNDGVNNWFLYRALQNGMA